MSESSQTARLLKFLKKHRSITNRQCVEVLRIYRYSARLADLRREGYIIPAVHVHDGLWRYEFHGQRDDSEPVKTPGVLERIKSRFGL
jgi:hypothetical protein